MFVVNLEEKDVKLICGWEYEEEYSIYNLPCLEVMIEQKWAITDEIKRKNQFRKVVDIDNNFIGYFRIQEYDDKIILGLGMNPCLCGKGNGRIFMETIINYLKDYNKNIELEVREFNKRAIKCYENAGFHKIKQEEKNTYSGTDRFIIMQREVM